MRSVQHRQQCRSPPPLRVPILECRVTTSIEIQLCCGLSNLASDLLDWRFLLSAQGRESRYGDAASSGGKLYPNHLKTIDPAPDTDAYLFAYMHNYSGPATVAAHADFLSLSHLRRKDVQALLGLSVDLRSKNMFAQALQGKSIAMIFEKPSLRTRVTFEVAIRQLGGWPIMLGSAESRLGEREPIQDLARNLSCWVDAIVARVFKHHDLENLALFASVPVINGLSDHEHPCQTLADLLTLSDIWPTFT